MTEMTTPPTAEELMEMIALGAATLFHGNQERGAVDPAIKPIGPGMKFAGPAYTVDVPPGDNLALHLAIEKAAPGDVLAVDYKGHLDVAVTGDIMALGAKMRGIAGMVVDGAVRDADEIAGLGLPVFARGLSIRGPEKNGPGSLGRRVTIGGTRVSPGDIAVGDRDGVVIIAKENWREALRNASGRESKEASVKEGLRAGQTTVDLLGLRDAISIINVSLSSRRDLPHRGAG